MSEKQIDFKDILKGHPHDKEIHFVIHNFPDPDAIASALGMQHYMKSLGFKPGQIYYSGEISHPQNKSMITSLNIDLINYEDNPFEKSSKIILLDTSNVGIGSNQTAVSPDHVDIIAVVDHHKGKHPKGAKIDCRYVGATSSIIWEYLAKSNYDFESDEGKYVATALVTGISTDTNSLTSDAVSDLDFEAFKNLIKKIDRQKHVLIQEYPLPPYLFDLRQRAFIDENKMIEESTIVSGIGIISQSKRDALPIIADEFLRMTGITTSVVFAVIEDYIDISVRSKNITLDVGDFVQKVFGEGGGKQGSGRARIPLGFFNIRNSELSVDVYDVVKKLVFAKVLANVKGD